MANNYVYFIQDAQTGLIKIGLSRYPKQRIKQLGGSSDDYRILAVINARHTERELHDTFSDLRQYGEWFYPDPELTSFIRRIAIRADLWEKPPKNEMPKDMQIRLIRRKYVYQSIAARIAYWLRGIDLFIVGFIWAARDFIEWALGTEGQVDSGY